jgi:hypothetical protein
MHDIHVVQKHDAHVLHGDLRATDAGTRHRHCFLPRSEGNHLAVAAEVATIASGQLHMRITRGTVAAALSTTKPAQR